MTCGRPALPALRETLMDRPDQRVSARQSARAASMSVDSLAGAS
ncbi:Uncharacterised protein [Delftia tsuruhatensis]|nr:Uncharacterised protein [Delftia tsuruhatensis]CAC9693325.1 Uncharacterised protein [Delftia tsuruhatensis]